MTVTANRPVTPAEIQHTINTWIHRGLTNVRRYEEAKQRFADVTAAYTDRYPDDEVTAEFKAASDPRRQQAVADAQWYATEVSVAANTIAILRAAVGGAR